MSKPAGPISREISSYISGVLVNGAVYLNASEIALAALKSGHQSFARAVEEVAEHIRSKHG